MARKTISAIRREELIQSAITAIYKHGFADLTVAQIAAEAEVSTGNIHYYFGGKDALLEAAMRHLLTLLNAAHHRLLHDAGAPLDRLHATMQANFDETFLTLETCRVWMQFWAFAPYRPRLARLHRINRRRVQSNVLHALRDLVPSTELTVATNAIQGYMDGVWVQIAQSDLEPDLRVLQEEAARFVVKTVGDAAHA